MSEETVKAFEELAQVERELLQKRADLAGLVTTCAELKTNLQKLTKRKRELLKVVKVVRVRKPKAEPKPRKTRADKGKPRKGAAKGKDMALAQLGSDSKGEPETIDPSYMQPGEPDPKVEAFFDSVYQQEDIDPADQEKIDKAFAALDAQPVAEVE